MPDWLINMLMGHTSRCFRGSLQDSFHSKWNTFVAVWPSFYMMTVCWHPWNCKLVVPECNLLKSQPSFRLCKLANPKPVNTMTTLMLMLAHSSLVITKFWLNTPQCSQSKSNMTTVYWGEFKCQYYNFTSQSTAEFLQFYGFFGLSSNRK